MQRKIAFFCNWGMNSKQLFERYRQQTPNDDGIWEDIEAVENINEANHYVVLDGLPHNVSSLDFDKTFCFQREPECIVRIPPFHKYKVLYKGFHHNHYHISTWWIKKKFNELIELPIGEKKKRLSCVCSSKSGTKGQKARVDFINAFRNKHSDLIDIYGRGLGRTLNYNDFCKFNGLYDYRYSFAFENCRSYNYFTEKIIDCFLTWTVPIYWGCSNISTYFPKESYYEIDIEDLSSIDRVKEIIEKPVDYDALKKARELVLKHYNLFPSIKKVIDNDSFKQDLQNRE